MVSVSEIHTAHSVNVSRCPRAVVAYEIGLIEVVFAETSAAVCLDVGLVYYVKSHNVRKRNEHRVRRIVRRSYRVYVKLFHKNKVFFYVRGTHHVAGFCIAVVMVYTLKFYFFAVEFKYVAENFYMLEAGIISYGT